MRTFEESWSFQDGVTGNSEHKGPSPSLTQELSGALGCLGPSPWPSRAPQLPGRTTRTLEVACRVHTHPALPLSNMPPPPTPRAQHRDRGTPETGPQQVEGEATAQLPAALHLPPRPPSQQYLCRGHALLPSDTPSPSSPQTSPFQAFLVLSSGPRPHPPPRGSSPPA